MSMETNNLKASIRLLTNQLADLAERVDEFEQQQEAAMAAILADLREYFPQAQLLSECYQGIEQLQSENARLRAALLEQSGSCCGSMPGSIVDDQVEEVRHD